MNNKDYTTTFMVDQTPEEVFQAINNVRGWWTGEPGVEEGNADKLGDEFAYRYGDVHYSRQKVTEFVPNKKVVWLVVEAKLNFVEQKNEWKGTKITFEIAKKGDKTEVRFSHVGLVPEFECFNDCSNAWGFYVNTNLKNLIIGKRKTSKKEK
jgi:hypothetical protein